MRFKEFLQEADEIFTFGKWRWNVSKIHQAIKDGVINPPLETVDIVKWAEEFLRIHRDRPDHNPHSFFVGINYDHVGKISDDRMKEPVLMAPVDGGYIFIDGNHRIVKAYRAGINQLQAYILSKADVKKVEKIKKKKISEGFSLSAAKPGDRFFVLKGGFDLMYFENDGQHWMPAFFRDQFIYVGKSSIENYLEFRTVGATTLEADQFNVFINVKDAEESLGTPEEFNEIDRRRGRKFLDGLIDEAVEEKYKPGDIVVVTHSFHSRKSEGESRAPRWIKGEKLKIGTITKSNVYFTEYDSMMFSAGDVDKETFYNSTMLKSDYDREFLNGLIDESVNPEYRVGDILVAIKDFPVGDSVCLKGDHLQIDKIRPDFPDFIRFTVLDENEIITGWLHKSDLEHLTMPKSEYDKKFLDDLHDDGAP